MPYTPPTIPEMQQRQMQPTALRLLIVQRRLYTRSKRYRGIRATGVGVIAVVAPIISVIVPSWALAATAITAAWLFLGRTVLTRTADQRRREAAAVQEQLDQHIFGLPAALPRTPKPSREDLIDLAGADESLLATAEDEQLTDWYTFRAGTNPVAAVAIAQRENAAYSHRLLRQVLRISGAAAILWALLLLTAAVLVLHLDSTVILLGVVLPLLPAGLDVWEQWNAVRIAADQRKLLADEITDRLDDHTVTADQLPVWQDDLYRLRCTTPLIPDWLYRLHRPRNERVMQTTAQQLSTEQKEPL